MNKLLLSLLILLSSAYSLVSSPSKVYINKIVDHPALDKTVEGIREGLANSGFTEGKNLEFKSESAQGNVSLANQITSKFINSGADVIVGLGTVSAQSALKPAREKKVQLVFSSITDPESAGLLSDPEIVGVSNFIPLKPQIEFFKKLQPNLKTLGILYNSGELNSIEIVKKLEIVCSEMGIKLVKQTVTKSSEVPQAAQKLATQVDAIFISNDNTALSAIQVISNIATQASIPVYVSDTDAVELGAVAAYGPNQYEVGVLTGEIIAKRLKGEPVTQQVNVPQKTDIVINQKALHQLGLQVPVELQDSVTLISGDGK